MIDLLLPDVDCLDDFIAELLVELNVSSVNTLLLSKPWLKLESSVWCASWDKLSSSFNVLVEPPKSRSE